MATPNCRPRAMAWWPPSFLLRTYEDAVVRSAPDPAAVYEALPGAHVELLVRVGQRLSENDDDVLSHRLAVVALSGPDRESLLERYEAAADLLDFDLTPVAQNSPWHQGARSG